MRSVEITPDFLKSSLGSVLISMGDTRVLCTANVEDRVPPFMVGKSQGWVTAEYAMIPGATNTRSQREVSRGRASGRTMEIQRLIGRALRTVVDRTAIGERTVWVDCEVLQADGGTRTAAITGGFAAMCLALSKVRKRNGLHGPPILNQLAAISVGVVEGKPVLDLDYVEDSAADVDMNVVRTDDGRYIELQGTAETTPFERSSLDRLLELADIGTDQLHEVQRKVLGSNLTGLMSGR